MSINLTVTISIRVLIITRIISFFLARKKVIMCLLSLEFIVLNMFLAIIYLITIIDQIMSYSIFILVLGACEARLGLRLIINITRFKGNDILSKPFSKF